MSGNDNFLGRRAASRFPGHGLFRASSSAVMDILLCCGRRVPFVDMGDSGEERPRTGDRGDMGDSAHRGVAP